MADPLSSDDLAAIEEALGTIVRQSKSARQHQRIAELGAVSLETSLYPVLRRIGDRAPRLTELADQLNVDVSTVSRQVRQLEDSGLVRRATDPEDGRASALSLTGRGEQALHDLRVARRLRIAELVDGWSRKDRADLARLLTRLAEALESTTSTTSSVAPR